MKDEEIFFRGPSSQSMFCWLSLTCSSSLALWWPSPKVCFLLYWLKHVICKAGHVSKHIQVKSKSVICSARPRHALMYSIGLIPRNMNRTAAFVCHILYHWMLWGEIRAPSQGWPNIWCWSTFGWQEGGSVLIQWKQPLGILTMIPKLHWIWKLFIYYHLSPPLHSSSAEQIQQQKLCICFYNWHRGRGWF